MAGSDELLKIVDRLQGTEVVVVGDIILDHYTWGKVNRISPEAPVVVVQVTEESRRLGGAGNVAHNLAALGASVSICGVVGDDDAGRHVIASCEDLGINVEGVLVDRSRPTPVKNRVIAHSQQVVRVDKEITEPLSATYSDGLATALSKQFEKSKAVIVSDYGKGTISQNIFQRIKEADDEGLLGLDTRPVFVDPKAPNFDLYSPVTVIKPNRMEAQEASGITISSREDAIEAGKALLSRWGCELLLITLGEDGMVLLSAQGDEPVQIDTMAREVYDVSGAGDTVTSVFSLAMAAGSNPEQAAVLANLAAGVVVGEVGTVALTIDQLRDAVKPKS